MGFSRLLHKLRPAVTAFFKTSSTRCSENVRRSDVFNSSSPRPRPTIRYHFDLSNWPWPSVRKTRPRPVHLNVGGKEDDLEIRFEKIPIEDHEYQGIVYPTLVPARGLMTLLNTMSPLIRWLRSTNHPMIMVLSVVSPHGGLVSTACEVRTVMDTYKGLCIRIGFPGVKDHVEVSVQHETTIVIRAQALEEYKYFMLGRYSTMIVLPHDIYDTSNMERDMDIVSGELELTIPKKQVSSNDEGMP